MPERVQVLIAPHAPLVLASMEPHDRGGADMLRAELRAVLPDTDPFWLGVRAWYRSLEQDEPFVAMELRHQRHLNPGDL